MSFPFILIFTQVASTEGFLVAVGILLVILFVHCGWRRALEFFACAFGLMVSVEALKEFFRTPRPLTPLIDVTGYAFPSGHAAGAAFIAVAVSYLVRHRSKPVRYGVYLASLSSAIAIGISRVAFMVHTPFQVFGGYVVGIVFALLYIWLDSRFETLRRR